jgi:hypothetical protein
MAPVTRIEQYREARRFVREAAEAVDQAHAVVKDLKLEKDIEIRTVHGAMRIGTLSKLLSDMVLEMEAAELLKFYGRQK